ncbi:hypothetical protein Pint_07695 [Pistacia integerrima]|uniref:Uncharacterized protein n=1 Tax=Pistacia integerrima TaxID=434235 RepID=A0ACC0XXF7_9ROSI|nr:hypothetical protein Pint_07695 [Pistacia integerrima]
MIKLSQLFDSSAVGWDVTKQLNPCLWKGINCSGGSLITQLSLSGFGLSDSEFLSVVCNISSLQLLDVSENQFSSIPDEFITDCGRIGSIPHRIVKLAKLEALILSVKMLDGGIPANFSRSIPDKMSPSLVRLRLGSNSLNGVIPSANFATLEKLTYLELDNNSFRIGSLQVMKLQLNNLSGDIPLEKLTNLELDNNSFTGMIPPELGDCQTLTLLNLAQNKLNGSLPARLGNLSSLQVKKLQLNNLSGDIPVHNQLRYTSGTILLLELPSKNIMLKSLKEPHLGDIELRKVIDPSKRTSSLSTLAGSVGYIPPDYCRVCLHDGSNNGWERLRLQSYSLELLTRKPPISEGTELAKLVLPNWEHEDININATSLAIKKPDACSPGGCYCLC